LGWWIRSTTSVGAVAKRLIPNAMHGNPWHLEETEMEPAIVAT
jgi:hypothetical protein